MAQPNVNTVHVDQILTNLSVRYMQDASVFVATKVFPVVPVDKKSDLFYKFNKGDWFRDEAQRRGPATESAGSGYGTTTDRYSCDVYAMHKDIDSQTRANADSVFNLDREAAEFVTQRLLLRQEKLWVSTFFGTGVWGTDIAGVASPAGANQFVKWSDYVNSDPIGDVDTAKELMLQTTGYEPNTMLMSYSVYRKIRNHPDIIERLKYTNAVTGRFVTEQMLAAMFDIDNVYIARAVENVANEGATPDMEFVWPDSVLLTYTPATAGILTPASGYTFVWRDVSAGLGANIGISRFYMPEIKADRIEGEIALDQKLVGADLGYFMSAVL